MIHFLPDTFATDGAEIEVTPYGDAVAMLASIRTALGVAEQAAGIDGGPLGGAEVESAWGEATWARKRCFEKRSVESAQAAAAGLEMLAAQRTGGAQAHPRSVELLALTLRRELTGLDRLFSL